VKRVTDISSVDPGPPSIAGTVALVGRPNVGKSSLFNRLVGGRPALVEDTPGVTRDRRYGIFEWEGIGVEVIDTGGLDPDAEGILGAMRGQTLRAVDEAQVLVLVIDALEGPMGLDDDVARVLRKTGKPVIVAANKADNAGRAARAAEAHSMGFRDVFPVSATHGRGVGDLLDKVVSVLAPNGQVDGRSTEPDKPIRLAFLGKPNAGKSSMVNRLLGEERVLVHDKPGTTRDPIDTPFQFDEENFILIDTAGLRRRRTVKTLTEAVSGKMARDQVARADVVALVVDLTVGATDEDARLANLAEDAGRALVVVYNKADRLDKAQLKEKLTKSRERLSFVRWAPEIAASALTGRSVLDLPAAAQRAYAQWHRRVPTSQLNRLLEEVVAHRPPPAGAAGRHMRLYFMTQPEVAPPTFFVSANSPPDIKPPYRRYLTNQIRKAFKFEGAPLRLVVRSKNRQSSESREKREKQENPRGAAREPAKPDAV